MIRHTLPAFLTSLISLFSSLLALASPAQVRIGILDTPVDLTHPDIAPAIDTAFLGQLDYAGGDGHKTSWYDLNETERNKLKSSLDPQELELLLDVKNVGGALNASDEESARYRGKKGFKPLLHFFVGQYRLFSSPSHRTQFALLQYYLHGTHVAGIALDSLSNVELVPFPAVAAPPQFPRNTVPNFDPENERQKLRSHFSQLTRVLTEHQIRVTNISLGMTETSMQAHLWKNNSRWFNTSHAREIERVARAVCRLYIEEQTRFFQENPETIFVLSAGNDRLDLSNEVAQGRQVSYQINEPNVLKVASVNKDGDLSIFSNRSPKYVQIAAPGEGIVSAQADGGQVFMTGTSMAAPMVTNRLAKIFQEIPELTATQAIEALFQHHTRTSSKLTPYILNGRVLITRPTIP